MDARRITLAGLTSMVLACTPGPGAADGRDGSTGASSSSSSSSSSSDDGTDGSESDGTAGVDSSSEGGSTGDAPPSCELPPGSPPSVLVDGHRVAPIDVLALQATLRFDAAAQTGSGVATLTFRSGPEGGLPLFDLRQAITAVRLDGVALGPHAAPVWTPGDDPEQSLRVVNAELEPCSEHTLELEYEVVSPPGATFPLFDPSGVVWCSNFSDLAPGRYAEMWLPSNLPHDELALALDVEVVGTDAPHLFAANGDVTTTGELAWHVEFPPHFSAMSPLVVLSPAAITERVTSDEVLPDGHAVTIEVLRLAARADDIDDFVAAAALGLSQATLELGEYPHGDRYLVFASGLIAGMEFPGGTLSSAFAVPHEAFHAWIARGIRPLRHRDGWIDEAWTTWAIDFAYVAEPLVRRSPPSTMAPDDPWLRITPVAAYMVGPNMLASFAEAVGTDALRGTLREFYVAHAGEFVTTEQLQAHLAVALGDALVTWAFDRFVTGTAP